jgi:hypothetical protein
MRKESSDFLFAETRHVSTSMTSRWSSDRFMRIMDGPAPASARSMGSNRPEGLSLLNRSRSMFDIPVVSPHSADANDTFALDVPTVGGHVITNAAAKPD